jgi:hypothetical protein
MILVAATACILGIVHQVSSHLRYHNRIRAIVYELGRPTSISVATDVPLGDALDILASCVSNPSLPEGLPIRFDPSLRSQPKALMASAVSIDVENTPLSLVFEQVLNPLGLTYVNKDGLVTICAKHRK